MTRDEILAMQPGRELDALVQERVFGSTVTWQCNPPDDEGPWDSDWDGSFTKPVPCAPNDKDAYPVCVGEKRRDIPRYSTDIGAAWQVVEKLRESGWLIEVKGIPAEFPWEFGQTEAGERSMPVWKQWYCAVHYFKGRASNDVNEIRRYVMAAPYAVADTAPEAICKAALLAVTPE